MSPAELCERGSVADVLFAARQSQERAAELTVARRLKMASAGPARPSGPPGSAAKALLALSCLALLASRGRTSHTLKLSKDCNNCPPCLLLQALDASLGLHYLHCRGMVHRDVKSPNFLVTNEWTTKVGAGTQSALPPPASAWSPPQPRHPPPCLHPPCRSPTSISPRS